MRWFRKITADPSDLSPIADAVDFFLDEHKSARDDLNLKGRRISVVAGTIPGTIEYRYAQLQELEMILKHLEVLTEREIVKQTKWFMENYPRGLNENTAKRYAEAHDDVYVLVRLKHEVAVVRNNFLALFKGIEALHYQIRNIVDLRKAGIEDAEF